MFDEEDGGEHLSNHQILILHKDPTRGVLFCLQNPGTEASEFDPWLGASDDSLFEEPDDPGSGLHESSPGYSQTHYTYSWFF
jgi:hypothetical protein